MVEFILPSYAVHLLMQSEIITKNLVVFFIIATMSMVNKDYQKSIRICQSYHKKLYHTFYVPQSFRQCIDMVSSILLLH